MEYSVLHNLYVIKRKSVAQIAQNQKCSQNKVDYWLSKYGIRKRTISEAIYQLKNPVGDPFLFNEPKTLNQHILFGMGLGLYWGEGLKRGKGE